jgi:hypothetical protein
VAGAGTEPSPGRATLTTQRNPRGTVLVDARITGDLTGVTRVRLAWKRPLDSAWTDVDPPRAFVPSAGTISFSVTLPADAAVVTFGLFTDEDPRLLLGTAGDRAPAVGGQLLGIAPNPALGAAQIVLEPGDAARTLRVCDVRGRLIRTLTVPAFARTAIWDGRDGAGALAASGRYVVVLTEAPGGSTVLTLIR